LPQSLPAIKPNKTFIEVYFVVFSRIQIKIFANTGCQLFPVCLVFSLMWVFFLSWPQNFKGNLQ
jgi:hypothetical protein